MIVSTKLYNDMCDLVIRAIHEQRTVTSAECIAYDFDCSIIYSIYNQIYVRMLKRELVLPSCFVVNSEVDSTVNQDLHRKIIPDATFTSSENNLIKECLGLEYEEILVNKLTSMKMCFETEAQQRRRGKPKTPDILFHIPMAVITDPSKPPVVINWIDSKAMFADEVTYREHIEQLKGYTNRYGRGMVIYWYGFCENVLSLNSGDMIVITDCFPEQWFRQDNDL